MGYSFAARTVHVRLLSADALKLWAGLCRRYVHVSQATDHPRTKPVSGQGRQAFSRPRVTGQGAIPLIPVLIRRGQDSAPSVGSFLAELLGYTSAVPELGKAPWSTGPNPSPGSPTRGQWLADRLGPACGSTEDKVPIPYPGAN